MEDGSDDKNTPSTENPPESKSWNGNIPQKGLENGSEEFSTGVNKEPNGNSGHVNEEQSVIEKENATEFENPVEDVSGQLNSIINCLEATKFVQLDDPDRQFWQMFSLKENPAEALGSKQESAMKLVALTQRGLARVYPAGTRVDSSNYNPIPFWMRGFQMAALNLQTRDEGCQINSAFFEQNSGCGYVLKPEYMLRSSLYSPLTLTDEAEVSVKLNLLAGHNLGVGDIVVELHLHGHPLDETSCQWSSSPAAGPHPHWPESGAGGQVVLTVRRPQLAVLEVKLVRSSGSALSSLISLPLLPQGFRRLVIRSEDLQPPPSLTFKVAWQ